MTRSMFMQLAMVRTISYKDDKLCEKCNEDLNRFQRNEWPKFFPKIYIIRRDFMKALN